MTDTLGRLRAVAHQIAALDAERATLVATRDILMRTAKAEGATWADLQEAAQLNSPTAVARALRRGL